MNGTLHIIEPGKADRVFELKGVTSIGRTPENDIVLEAEGASRRHAIVLVRGDKVVIVDLGSTNGTYVNGVQALPQRQTVLGNGDLITIGLTTLRYDAQAAQPRAVGVAPPAVAARLPQRQTLPARQRRAPPPPSDGRFAPRVNGTPIDPGRLLRYLPGIYHDDDLLDRFLRGIEDVLTPIERTVAGLDQYADPRLAPEDLLPWLAFWVGLSVDERWSEAQRRALIGEAASLYPWRGTKCGLRRAIELVAGHTPEIIEPKPSARSGRAHLFQVVLRVPEPALIDRQMIESVIEEQKPAHTAYLLEIVEAEQSAATVASPGGRQ